MGEIIEYQRPDGQKARGYLATPAGSANAKAAGVVVAQEWWGLNEQIKGVAGRLAAAGFRALVPDLYRGKVAKNADEAGKLMGGVNWPDAVEQDLRGALNHLKSAPGATATGAGARVAVLGFCMGGGLTLHAASRLSEPEAAVCFYGIPPESAADPRRIRAPLLCHFARKDEWCTPAAVDQLEAKLKEGKVSFELFRYDAQHAFCNEKRPEVYDAAAAKLAWERTLAFLKRNLG